MGLDTVELVMAIEEEFDLEIPNETCALLETPRQVIDWIVEVREGSALAVPREQVAAKVKQITIHQSGIRENRYWERGKFIADFGMD